MSDLSGAPPTLPGRYEFLETLGHGGLGAVFKARDTSTGRIVAVKTVAQGDDRVQALLMREARLLASLSHPGVVAVHDMVLADDRIFVVQDYVDGDTLGEWQAGAPLPEILHVYEHIALALAYVHACGLVHRDLKPTNVLVRRGDDRPVIVDFGLAVRSKERDSLTAVGTTVIGTPGYMSPETIEGVDGGAPSDVFALGVMLAEGVSHRQFWQQGSVTEILVRRLREQPQDVLAGVPEVQDVGLAPLVAGMMARVPAERPSAAAVAEALAEHRATIIGVSKPVAAAPAAPARPISAPSPRSSPFITLDVPVPVGMPGAEDVVLVPAARASSAALSRSILLAVAAAAPVLAFLAFVWGGGGAIALFFIALFVAGLGFAISAALRRREKRRGAIASVQAVAHRISAIEAQVMQAGEMTRTLAMAIDHIGQQVSPERLQEVIRQTVIVALRELQPAANAESESKRARELLAIRQRSVADRVKEYGGILGGVVTAAAALVGLLGTTDMWRPNRPPEIVRFGSDADRLRRAQPFMLPVEARDEDGDDLTFTWTASAGRVEGAGAAAIWVPPAALLDRVVSLTLTVSDGTRATTRTRTLRVNEPPNGQIVVNGAARLGRVVPLAVKANDADGDPLQYNWVVSSGQLAQSSGSTVLWTVPSQPGEAQALCQVSDGYETVPLTLAISIGK
jgi:predicted Ser/Thr protein kinase